MQMKELVDGHYPDAEKITLVMDNLNTHWMSCLYAAFSPCEAHRLIDKLKVQARFAIWNSARSRRSK